VLVGQVSILCHLCSLRINYFSSCRFFELILSLFWSYNKQSWSHPMICCKHALCGKSLMCMYGIIFYFNYFCYCIVVNRGHSIEPMSRVLQFIRILTCWILWCNPLWDLLYFHALTMLFDCFSPIVLRKFDSGVMVIQNKSHSDEEVCSFSLFIYNHFSVRFFFMPCPNCDTVKLCRIACI
jgi:hypothetical protein